MDAERPTPSIQSLVTWYKLHFSLFVVKQGTGRLQYYNYLQVLFVPTTFRYSRDGLSIAEMVFFSCDGCGEMLKKAQVDSHVYKCKVGCDAVSCVDCSVSFYGGESDYRPLQFFVFIATHAF